MLTSYLITPAATLSRLFNQIVRHGIISIMLSNGINFTTMEALKSLGYRRTLLSFKDIEENYYHIATTVENGIEFVCITSYKYSHKNILEKIERFPKGFYIKIIRIVEAYFVAGQKLGILKKFYYGTNV